LLINQGTTKEHRKKSRSFEAAAMEGAEGNDSAAVAATLLEEGEEAMVAAFADLHVVEGGRTRTKEEDGEDGEDDAALLRVLWQEGSELENEGFLGTDDDYDRDNLRLSPLPWEMTGGGQKGMGGEGLFFNGQELPDIDGWPIMEMGHPLLDSPTDPLLLSVSKDNLLDADLPLNLLLLDDSSPTTTLMADESDDGGRSIISIIDNSGNNSNNYEGWEGVFDDAGEGDAGADSDLEPDDVLRLLDQLGDLNLDDWKEVEAFPERGNNGQEQQQKEEEEGPPPWLDGNDDFGDGESASSVPSYLYCQPCSTTTASAATAAAPQDFQQQPLWMPPRPLIERLRPQATGAIQLLAGAFGIEPLEEEETPDDVTEKDRDGTIGTTSPIDVSVSDPHSQQPSETSQTKGRRHVQERIGIGHRERILGVDASECGRFVATASQDGTARVWNFAHNRLLATLAHGRRPPTAPASADAVDNYDRSDTTAADATMSYEYECLRVAFAPVLWGFDRLYSSTPPSAVDGSDVATNEDEDADAPNTVTAATSSRTTPLGTYRLATGGADGRVCVWSCADPSAPEASCPWILVAELDHASLNSFFVPQDVADRPQIYSLQFVSHWCGLPMAGGEAQNSFLLTSSDDFVHLWEVLVESGDHPGEGCGEADPSNPRRSPHPRPVRFREVMSLRFGDMHGAGYGVYLCSVTSEGIFSSSSAIFPSPSEDNAASGAMRTGKRQVFGGDRNPRSLVYVFDARYTPSNGLLAAALSDGSLRLVNGRGVCVTLLSLPGGWNSHLTSFAFDARGRRLATTVATGHVILWDLSFEGLDLENGDFSRTQEDQADIFARALDADASNDNRDQRLLRDPSRVTAACRAVLLGHDPGRPVFGCCYFGIDDSSSGSFHEDVLLSWGSDGRVCAWDSRSRGELLDGPVAVVFRKPEYPVFAASVLAGGVVLAGGGSEPSFVGTPLYFYDFDLSRRNRDNADTPSEGSTSGGAWATTTSGT
jgi:WD40 repeat protein